MNVHYIIHYQVLWEKHLNPAYVMEPVVSGVNSIDS